MQVLFVESSDLLLHFLKFLEMLILPIGLVLSLLIQLILQFLLIILQSIMHFLLMLIKYILLLFFINFNYFLFFLNEAIILFFQFINVAFDLIRGSFMFNLSLIDLIIKWLLIIFHLLYQVLSLYSFHIQLFLG